MKLKPWHRRALLGAAAAVAFIAAVAGEGQRGEPAEAYAAVPQAAPPPAPPMPRVEFERLERARHADVKVGSAFGPTSWFVAPPPPPPKPVVHAPPPAPVAPPMPFAFLGRYEEDGARVILLVKGDRIYTVSEGEVIENTYRVERLTGSQLEMTYLPLNTRQTLQAGDS